MLLDRGHMLIHFVLSIPAFFFIYLSLDRKYDYELECFLILYVDQFDL